MNKLYLHKIVTRAFLLIALFLCTLTGWAQYQNGVRKGMVKVKFTAAMTTSLGRIQPNAKGNTLTTGIESVDAVVKKTAATNLYRLFPYDARYENKLRKHGLHLWYVIEIEQNADPKTVVAQFKQLKEVAVAEVEHEKVLAPYAVQAYTPGISTRDVLPFNDPMLNDQWHYNNTGQSGFADADINLFEAWTQTTGANNIVVSIHDQGVDVNHNDLKANVWVNQAEFNGVANVDDDGNGYIDDINGYNFEKNKGAVDPQYHGTHVAGTIAAVNNNGIGVSGVAGGNGTGNGVKVMSLQIFGGAAVEKSFVYAANNGAVISQNSWGYSSPGFFDQSVLDAIDYFEAEAGDFVGSPMKGGIVIFASGNSNYDGDWYPGYKSNTLAVSAVGPEWKKASYSNYGNWIELSAPGGDFDYNTRSGVLSTIPNNQYAYLEGTSMACPHVSGIAALALANRTHQLTNDELWNKLVTGVTSIEEHNPDYQGLLGSGSIDAALAIRNDQGIAPVAINNLSITGIAQEFATLSWAVPADGDDEQPATFELYHHTQLITGSNINAATKTIIKNTATAGTTFSYELDSLLGLTTYFFAITSTDRWGNVSLLSNVVTATTNEGPAIAVDANSQTISIEIDAASSTIGTHDITILNEAAGILRWSHFMRHTNTSLSFNSAALNYPKVTKQKTGESNVRLQNTRQSNPEKQLRSNEPQPMAFQSVEKTYASFPTNIIGETDLDLTNSAAAKFLVTESDGFNLTQVRMYLKHDPAIGPVILEIYKGSAPTKNNLIFAQEHSNWSSGESWAYITLNEQLYFESGSTFWIVFHVPAGNLFPLGIGFEDESSYSTNCFMSFDMGATWTPLETAINSEDFAWTVTAASYNAHLGTYLTLEPGSGDVNGNEQALATLTANAATLINGNYSANLVLASNDAQHQELRIPVNLMVAGHKPDIKHIDIADYGSVFQGTEKTLEFVLENVGYGNFNDPVFTIDNPEFSIVDWAPWQIKAREEATIKIKFSPTIPGNANGVLSFTNGDQTYQISLFGVGAETSKITLTPENQVINNIAIGDVVNAQIMVENTGAYPLKYFIPGFDEKGVSENWPTDYHSYGYKLRSNYASEAYPIAYEFQDISTTGVNITDAIKDDGTYYTLDMGFEFPYYGQNMQTLYIAQKGFTTFDNSVRPINSPNFPGNVFSPKGIITPLGTFLSYLTQGEIFYQVEADRVIVQYDNVSDGWNPESITAQMVLYANGDIRFFYENMGFTEYNQGVLNIFIEDLNQTDGILVHNWNNPTALYSGLALGFDYPGPSIITSVANGSGILAPGASSTVDIELSTSSLVEGTIKRYVNFISNEPGNDQTSALVQLEITSGGTPQPVLSLDTIAFGNVFQGAVRSTVFTIKNPGTANVNITSLTMVNNHFGLNPDDPAMIAPGLYKKFEIEIPTNNIATLEDWLSINYADGTHDTIYMTGNVVEPPAINVDLSVLQETLAHGDASSHPLTIENTGLAPLEVVATGKQWLSLDAPSAVVSNSYTYEKHNSGGVYQWIDIRETGTQLPFWGVITDDGFWRTLELPFPIEFYGVEYTEFKIGDNGIISFEDDPAVTFFTDYIPSQIHPGPCIMPYWTFSGFSDYLYPIEDIGIFYQAYDDKFIITWSYFTNNFGGMGDPVSAQVIFYKNGTMKFQYKREEGGADITSHFGTIGLQKSSTEGMAISEYLPLDHGDGLAYLIIPANKYVIAPGTTLAADIKIDAANIYGGQYNESLKLQTNVPGSENLEKPVELTVTGEAVVEVDESVDFGSKMIEFEFGSPVSHYVDVKIGNTGSAAYDITWAQMADGTQGLSLQIWALVDGWFGPEWRWADISELYSPWAWVTPTFTVAPGDLLKARAVFAPSFSGDFTDELVLTTSVGEIHATLTGSGFEPPVMEAVTDAIMVTMNTTTETATRSIDFNNVNGASDLDYEVSIDFGRTGTSSHAAEAMAASGTSVALLQSTSVHVSDNGARPMSVYNRELRHTSKEVPDSFVGTNGTAPFTIATKYNAGPEGFNLSHVETWLRSETMTQVAITVQIRAGGSSLADAVLLAEGSLNFTGSGTDETGAWYAIAMDHPAGIYPNEDFYVVISYPFGLAYPQGIVNDEETVPGRYSYYSEGLWYDLQEVPNPGFDTFGWLMFVGEETAGNFSWLTVTSPSTGTVAAGESSSVNLLLEGEFSQRGNQQANIVIKSNDPANAIVTVPVTLHMNEAPHFINVPEGIVMEEGQTLTLNMDVADTEGNSFTVASEETYEDVTHAFSNGTLTVTLTPDEGDSGNFEYTFIATDAHNAVSEVVLLLEVLHKNQAPVYIGPDEPLSFTATGLLNEYSIGDFFSDQEGDDFTFSLSSDNTESVVVFVSENQFLIRPMATGEAKLAFEVTDEHGAVSQDTITVVVDMVLGTEEELANNGLGVYPNPTVDVATVTITNDWTGEVTVTVMDAAGRQYLAQQFDANVAREVNVDVSSLSKGIYILRASSKTKRANIKLIKK